MGEMIKAKPSQFKEIAKVCIKMKSPVMFWGGPGGGKSEMVRQAADELGYSVYDTVRGSQTDPVDWRGLPYLESMVTKWARPCFLPSSGKGVLFLDEINSAPPLVQAAMYQLVLERRIGEHKLGDDIAIIAAGNREEDGGVTSRMPTPLSNRFHTHVELVLDNEEWCKYAIQNDFHPSVIAFDRFRPATLYMLDKNSKAFPTPRTWEFASGILKQHLPQSIEHIMLCGCLGMGTGGEFSAYMRFYRELPDMDEIRRNPDKVEVPKRPETLYAVASAMACTVDKGSFKPFTMYSNRLPAEYGVLFMKDAVSKDSNFTKTPEFTKWALAHKDVVLG